MKNIDSAFRYTRIISLLVVTGSILLCLYTTARSYDLARSKNDKVIVLANGKVLEAYSSDRKDNLQVEAKDHIKVFHENFFTLSPDDKVIEANISKALYLSDASAKSQYDDLKEGNYYSNIISANINQTIKIDSIKLDMDNIPIAFRCYCLQTLTRPTSILTRSLITEGYLREVSRSENNAHGFLVERWKILENKDLSASPR